MDIQIGKVNREQPHSGSMPYGCVNFGGELCQENVDLSVILPSLTRPIRHTHRLLLINHYIRPTTCF